MKKQKLILLITLSILLIAIIAGCDKEKIVESTEYIETTEYVQLPGDTIVVVDTVYNSDSVIVVGTDTVTITIVDTLFQTNTVYDTITNTEYVYDTVTNTQYVYDTVTTTEYVYDTVTQTSYAPNEFTAFGALQYFTDPQVFEFINAEFGLSDGYIFYLSAFQMETTQPSNNIYDLYGYIDYWTPDWSGYYALEFYFRMTYLGGDPGNPNNWQMSDPPTTGVAPHNSGIHLKLENQTDYTR